MLLKKVFYTILISTFTFGLISCSDNTTGIDNSEATINGSVEGSTSKENAKALPNRLEGTVVTAARVTSTGSAELLEGAETETNASGEFTLSVNTDVADQIVLIAQTESGELKGFLSSNVENGNSYTLKPLNIESTAETEIFTELTANGSADLVQKSDIETVVKSDAAAEIESSSSAIAEIASGLSVYAQSRAEFLAEMGKSEAEAKLDQALETMAEAQFQYESDVAASSSSDQRETAFETLVDARVEAFVEAGVDAESIAKLAHMQVNVMQNSFSSASSNIETNIHSATSLFAAIAVDHAAQVNAEASGMSDATVSAIADAGVTLRAEIKDVSGTSADVEAHFETYHDEVRAAMENDSSVEASVVIEIDTQINSSNGSKSVFNSALSGVIGIDLLTDIYIAFENSIESNVESQNDLLGEVDTEAMTRLFLLINLSS